MKVITTNRLNRFWKNGVLPIKNSLASKLNTANIVNNLLTTAAGYALDARQGKALDDKITALNGKSTKDVTVTISGLSHTFRLTKVGKIVFCVISAVGSLSAKNAALDNVIPDGFRPVGGVFITAKNVAGTEQLGTTRYFINTNGRVAVDTDETRSAERYVSVSWITN